MRTVTFELPASELELINRQGRRVVEPGRFKVMLGGSSVDLPLGGGFEVVEAAR